jgi:hypothetical protein
MADVRVEGDRRDTSDRRPVGDLPLPAYELID